MRLWGVHHIGVDLAHPQRPPGPAGRDRAVRAGAQPAVLGNIALWVGFAVSARLVWLAPVVIVAARARVPRDRALGRDAARIAPRRGLPRLRRARAALDPDRCTAATADRRPQRRERFSWRETLFSERGTLIAIAVGYLLLWIKLGTLELRSQSAFSILSSALLNGSFLSVCHRYQDATERYGRHASPIFSMRFGVGPLPQPVEPLHRDDDAEIADRQHVGPMQAEHQEHLGGPAAESLHRDQPLDHRFVGQRLELVELQASVASMRADRSRR